MNVSNVTHIHITQEDLKATARDEGVYVPVPPGTIGVRIHINRLLVVQPPAEAPGEG